MFRTALATVVTGAAADGSLGLTWEDCGDSSTHAKTTSVSPSSIALGVDTTITGVGTSDKELTGGAFDLHMTAGGGLINKHFTGNNCEAKSFNLPLGLGTMSWGGVSCPMPAGALDLSFNAQLSSSLPASLATSKLALTALDQDGDNAICVNINLAKEGLEANAAGSLGLTWEDCGDSSTHCKTTSVSPSSIALGVDTAITGEGTSDKALTGGTFDLHMTAGGGLINQHFTGNNCEAKSFNLPLGLGTMSWGGVSCPLAVGAVDLSFNAQLSSSLPASLATSKLALTALDQDGDDAICVNINLQKAEILV